MVLDKRGTGQGKLTIAQEVAEAIALRVQYGGDVSAAAADAAANLPPAAGNSLVIPSSGPLKITLLGSGLAADSDGVPTAGTVTHIQITKKSSGKINTLTLYDAASATDLVDAIAAGSGKVTATNYSNFYQLIYTHGIIATGSSGGDVFDGTIGVSFDDEYSSKSGADRLYINDGNDFFNGGKGSDTADASWLKVKVNANLAKGTLTHANGTTTLKSIENVTGSNKDDTIVGNGKKNQLDGSRGKDNIKGQGGNDLIEGGKGNDTLNGGKGKDKFLFHKRDGTDKIVKFQDGQDKLVLKGFGFKSKKAALKHFYEIGGANDDKVGFDYKGTKIIIKGADLKDIDATDILI